MVSIVNNTRSYSYYLINEHKLNSLLLKLSKLLRSLNMINIMPYLTPNIVIGKGFQYIRT